jgi:hypothetical protein
LSVEPKGENIVPGERLPARVETIKSWPGPVTCTLLTS